MVRVTAGFINNGSIIMVRIKWFSGRIKNVRAVALVDKADIVDAQFVEPLSIGNREDIRDGKIANRLFVDWCYGGWCEVSDVIDN